MKNNVYYWQKSEPVQNYGDFLSAFLLEEIFLPLGFTSRGIHIVGSVVDDMFVPEKEVDTPSDLKYEKVIFWGCGVRSLEGLSESRRPLATILSIRGPASASALRLGATVPQGDPAFLLPAFHTLRPIPEFQGKTVCIPHFHDKRSDVELLELSGCDVVLRPNIGNHIDDIRRFIDELGSADFVLSAALHGALTAAAYERPFAFWDNGLTDIPFKWGDAAASMGIAPDFAREIHEARKLYAEVIKPKIQIPSLWPSLAVAPLMLRPVGLLKAMRYELSSRLPDEALAEVDRLLDVFDLRREHGARLLRDVEERLEYYEFESERKIAEALARATAAENAREVAVAEIEVERIKNRRQIEKMRLRSEAIALQRDKEKQGALTVRDEVHRAWQSQLNIRQAELDALLNARQAELDALRNSTIWKMTWPIRRIAGRLPPFARVAGRRAAKAVWWASTLQFGRFRRSASPSNTSQSVLETPVSTLSSGQAEQATSQTRMSAKIDWLAPVVVIIDSVYPRPDKDSGSVDAINFIKAFQMLGYQVIFIADAEFSSNNEARKDIEQFGVHCVTSDEFGSTDDFIRESSGMVDLFFLSRVYCGGRFIELIKRESVGAKIIFNTVDLHHVREERQARLAGDTLALNLAYGTRERELTVARLADATIVVSETEERLLENAIPGVPVYTIKLARDCPGRINDFAERSGIGFIGGYQHLPNIDAVKYFLDEVWPQVRKKLPDVNFYAMGADMPEELSARTDDGFVSVGYVSDLAGEFEKLRLTVAPLRFGAGVKGKVASSLAHGVPCIATPVGAEGMGLVDDFTISTAKTPDEFAELVVKLYNDEEAWNKLSDAGVNFIAEHYSFASTKKRLADILTDVRAPVLENLDLS